MEDALDSYEQTMKEYKNELRILETKLVNKDAIISDLEGACVKVDDVGRLQKEIDQKSNIILQLREQLKGLEANPLPTDEDVEEMARLAEEKDSRIAELEDALRESMIISTKREEVLHQEEKKRKQILEKVVLFSCVKLFLIVYFFFLGVKIRTKIIITSSCSSNAMSLVSSICF